MSFLFSGFKQAFEDLLAVTPVEHRHLLYALNTHHVNSMGYNRELQERLQLQKALVREQSRQHEMNQLTIANMAGMFVLSFISCKCMLFFLYIYACVYVWIVRPFVRHTFLHAKSHVSIKWTIMDMHTHLSYSVIFLFCDFIGQRGENKLEIPTYVWHFIHASVLHR